MLKVKEWLDENNLLVTSYKVPTMISFLDSCKSTGTETVTIKMKTGITFIVNNNQKISLEGLIQLKNVYVSLDYLAYKETVTINVDDISCIF